jgi:peptide/nickel transport system substrate-binding protein
MGSTQASERIERTDMRRKLLGLLVPVLVGVFAIGLSACGGDDDGGAEPTGDFEAPTEAPGDAQKGGILTIVNSGDVDNIDPGAAYYQFSYQIDFVTQRPLLSWPPPETETPQPDLAAEQPEVSNGNKTVTFKLRDGIKFSPPVHREVKSADVKYAIERGLLPGVANGYIGAYMGDLVGFAEAEKAVESNKTVAPDISGIETPDDKTIVFNLARPVASVFLQALSLPLSAPVPEEYAKEFDAKSPSAYGEHQVATGPYMIENNEQGELTGYSPGKEIHLVRNPNWDEGTDDRPAYVDEVISRQGFADAAAASRRVLQGDSQVNGDILPPPAALKLATQDHPDQLALTPSGGNRYIAMNTTIPPFDDINVRKAVIAAADREALRLARGGALIGDIATHFIPPEIPGFAEGGGDEGAGVDFLAAPEGDPQLAAEYMKKAGYESGKYEGDERLLMVGENAGVDKQVTEVAADIFEKLGFKLNVREVNSDVMYTKFCQVPKAKVAICPTVGWLKDFNDPQSILDVTFSGDNISQVSNNNFPQLDVPEINSAIDKATLINDPDERAKAWGEIDKMITEQAPAIVYIWDKQPNIRSANVNGVINKFNATWDLAYTSIAQE